MAQTELLKKDQVDLFLRESASQHLCGTLSTLRDGKWQVFDIVIVGYSAEGVQLRVAEKTIIADALKPEQPVGLCLQRDHHKYLFESRIENILSVVQADGLKVETPEKVEKMPRRAYQRQPIPQGMTVRAMFWHRGHLDTPGQPPREDYWQGRIANLSAGGTMISVGQDHRDFFCIDQLVGVQFTPLSYQKPLLLEGRVRHLQPQSDGDALWVGVEFVGLEASPEGRDILHRLLDVIDQYEKLNNSQKA